MKISIPSPWKLKVVQNEDNLTYIASQSETREGVIVDPVREDFDRLLKDASEAGVTRWIGVIDTHTHADHVSCAARLSEKLGAPLIQQYLSPSKRIDIRVCRDTALSTAAGPLRLVLTPGHTPDGITVFWGPFVFVGDTLLYGDTGRDDLPGGDPAAHWDSLQKIKALARPETIFCTGHDDTGRVTDWKTQLSLNSSLTQGREEFVREAAAYTGPPPKHLKESLFENFK